MGISTVSEERIDQEDSYRVLVVDDNQALATVVAQTLEHIDEGLQATYTTDPERALTRLREESIDCLIADYEMPELDGLALAAADDTDTPFIIYTQRRDTSVERDVREQGGEFLVKQTGPEQYHQLAEFVREQVAD
jgi:CheY-like chemotaxis protein